MHTWTASPVAEIWRHLRYLRSTQNAKNLLQLNCDSGREQAWSDSDAGATAPEISACIRQADEYFQASRNVGLPTRPLLLFYCAQTLAKATILASDANVHLRSLNYDGLNTR